MTGEVVSEVSSCTDPRPRLQRPGTEERCRVGVEPGGAGLGRRKDYSSRRALCRRGALSGLAGYLRSPVG